MKSVQQKRQEMRPGQVILLALVRLPEMVHQLVARAQVPLVEWDLQQEDLLLQSEYLQHLQQKSSEELRLKQGMTEQ
jgi:hypothetical protein